MADICKVVSLTVSMLLLAGHGLAADKLLWKPNVFERYSHDEDIKDVLRNIVRQNGNQIAFLPGVEGTISFRFANMPLQGAFNMLMARNGLDHRFDAVANTVTIGIAGQMPRSVARRPELRDAPVPKIRPAQKPDFPETKGPTAASASVENPQGPRQKTEASSQRTGDFWVNSAPERLPEIDISTKFRLSGIARHGSNRIAFIDGREYEVGKSLGNMRIVEISSQAVRLEEETAKGVQPYILGFSARPR